MNPGTPSSESYDWHQLYIRLNLWLMEWFSLEGSKGWFWNSITRIWHAICVRYLTDLACHVSHAFGYGFEVYLTNMAIGFGVLYPGFGMHRALWLYYYWRLCTAHKLSIFFNCRTIIYMPSA